MCWRGQGAEEGCLEEVADELGLEGRRVELGLGEREGTPGANEKKARGISSEVRTRWLLALTAQATGCGYCCVDGRKP